jgi:hypothetical protein
MSRRCKAWRRVRDGVVEPCQPQEGSLGTGETCRVREQERFQVAPLPKPLAPGRVRWTRGKYEATADNSRYREANTMSDRNARQESQHSIVPQPSRAPLARQTRGEPAIDGSLDREGKCRGTEPLRGTTPDARRPTRVCPEQERILTLANPSSEEPDERSRPDLWEPRPGNRPG